jgi:hypothetical protein
MSAADAAEKLVQSIRPLLAGRSPQTQGAALADLLAIWLAGHVVEGNPAETDTLRDELLEAHIEAVRRLIPINSRQIHGDPRRFS